MFNNPAIVTTADGTVLAFAEGRAATQDFSSYAIVVRRSTDGGVTWSPLQQVVGVQPTTGIVISQPAPIVDKVTGQVFLLFNRGTFDGLTGNFHLTDVQFTKSSDDGLTWATPIDITDSVTVTEGHNPGPPGVYPDTPWGWAVVGPGHGIQIQNGPNAGRLIVGGDHRETNDNSGISWSHVIYSDDHGQTWKSRGRIGRLERSEPASRQRSLERKLDCRAQRRSVVHEHPRAATRTNAGGASHSALTAASLGPTCSRSTIFRSIRSKAACCG